MALFGLFKTKEEKIARLKKELGEIQGEISALKALENKQEDKRRDAATIKAASSKLANLGEKLERKERELKALQAKR